MDRSDPERRWRPHGLTSRELMVLQLVAYGLADKEIAVRLRISPLTVHKHVSNFIRKMGVSSRTEAAVLALRERVID
jgi:two-component system NarL family response regulator